VHKKEKQHYLVYKVEDPMDNLPEVHFITREPESINKKIGLRPKVNIFATLYVTVHNCTVTGIFTYVREKLFLLKLLGYQQNTLWQ